MTCRKRLEEMFRAENVTFSVRKHEEMYSAQRLAGLLHISGEQLAKVVMARADDQLVMLVLPAPARVDLGKVKKLLKAGEVSLAREPEFAELFADCEVGAMPPYGNLYGLPTYVDRTLSTQIRIAFPAGSHREAIELSFADYERTAKPVVANLSLG
jgi:Ala-tRNA(Pro) deacylase